MSVLLVTYDLNRPGQSYEALYEELKKASSWWHHLDSTWLLATRFSPDEWFERIRRRIDENDHVLIIEVTRNYNGWLPEKAWEWIREHLASPSYA